MLVYVFLKHQHLESNFLKLYFPEREKMTIAFFKIVFPWMGKVTFFTDKKKIMKITVEDEKADGKHK